MAATCSPSIISKAAPRRWRSSSTVGWSTKSSPPLGRGFARRAAQRAATLIAVGGYGRRELNLHSDIDLLALLPRAADNTATAAIESWVRFCWDVGLELGHSVRTCAECVARARGDVGVFTNLLDARLLAGDAAALAQLTGKLHRACTARAFFAAKLREQEARHLTIRRHRPTTSSRTSRKARAAWRDLHMLHWVAKRHFGGGGGDRDRDGTGAVTVTPPPPPPASTP